MPTTAKLVAAIWFAALGWLTANAHVPALGENAAVGLFREITALFGALWGWRICGRLAGQGYSQSAGTGLRTALTLALFSLLIFSTYQMVHEALRMRYRDTMEAVLGVFKLMMANAQEMLTLGVLGLLILGGILGGYVTEAAVRRWR